MQERTKSAGKSFACLAGWPSEHHCHYGWRNLPANTAAVHYILLQNGPSEQGRMSGAKLWDSPGMAVIYPQPAVAASLCLTGVLARLLFVRERMQTIQVICWRAQTDFGASSTSQSLRNVREDFFPASTALLFQKGTPPSLFLISKIRMKVG